MKLAPSLVSDIMSFSVGDTVNVDGYEGEVSASFPSEWHVRVLVGANSSRKRLLRSHRGLVHTPNVRMCTHVNPQGVVKFVGKAAHGEVVGKKRIGVQYDQVRSDT